jgi:4-hydroxy-4-methyl-2-oxoglutarate aldolase
VSGDAYASLAAFDTGTLCETGATPLGPGLHPVWASGRVVGRALTVECPSGQNLMFHRAVARAEPGDIIVGRCEDALFGYWGEVLAEAALAAGVRGLVIDGSVRDIEAIRDVGFPVFAAGTAIPGTGKSTAGSVGAPIEIRGARIETGDIVVADESGIVALAIGAVADVVERATARTEKERGMIERLRQGETTLSLLGLDGG